MPIVGFLEFCVFPPWVLSSMAKKHAFLFKGPKSSLYCKCIVEKKSCAYKTDRATTLFFPRKIPYLLGTRTNWKFKRASTRIQYIATHAQVFKLSGIQCFIHFSSSVIQFFFEASNLIPELPLQYSCIALLLLYILHC